MSTEYDHLPNKITYTLPAKQKGRFYRRVKSSGKTRNKFITDCIFEKQAQNEVLVQILAQAGQIADQLRRHEVSGDDLARELTLIRTSLMSALGRRS